MTVLDQARAWGIYARANSVPFERPDRLPKAFVAMYPYKRSTLGAIAAAKARYPDAAAFVWPHGRLTYQDLWRSSTALARGLQDEEGIDGGTRIGVLCRNNPLFVQALLAGSMLGADLVFLNTGLAAPQLAEVIASERITLVLHDDELSELMEESAVKALGATRCRRLMNRGSDAELPPPSRISALIILTSGTTGLPKGAERSSEGSLTGVAALLGRIPIRARDTIVLPSPFFHAWGLSGLLIGLSLSCTIVARPEFDPEKTLLDVTAHQGTVLMAVPAMLQRLSAVHPRVRAAADCTSLRVIASSGSAMPRQVVLDLLDQFGPVLYNVYGSTEVATATIATPADLRVSPTTAGRPAPGVRVRIVDGNDADVPQGVTGRVAVGNDARFSGYTAGGSKDTVDGLMLTGDMGFFDERGRLQIDGREDDMIVSGGENLYPREVEELLAGREDVADVAVLGVPDERFGQALKAFVVMMPDKIGDAEELRDYARQRLARFKVPVRWSSSTNCLATPQARCSSGVCDDRGGCCGHVGPGGARLAGTNSTTGRLDRVASYRQHPVQRGTGEGSRSGEVRSPGVRVVPGILGTGTRLRVQTRSPPVAGAGSRARAPAGGGRGAAEPVDSPTTARMSHR